jgi:signal recognition particle GTPase
VLEVDSCAEIRRETRTPRIDGSQFSPDKDARKDDEVRHSAAIVDSVPQNETINPRISGGRSAKDFSGAATSIVDIQIITKKYRNCKKTWVFT